MMDDANNELVTTVLHAKPHDVAGSIEWGLGFHPDPPAKFHVNLDLRKGSRDHKIMIQIARNSNGIKFDKADPIWVCETGACPPPQGVNSTQIEDIECTGDDSVLTFVDINAGEERVLTYQLNFIGAPPLDPMIRNGGF